MGKIRKKEERRLKRKVNIVRLNGSVLILH